MRLPRHARAAVWQAIVSDLSSIWQSSRQSGSVVSTATDSKRNRLAARSFHLALPRTATHSAIGPVHLPLLCVDRVVAKIALEPDPAEGVLSVRRFAR